MPCTSGLSLLGAGVEQDTNAKHGASYFRLRIMHDISGAPSARVLQFRAPNSTEAKKWVTALRHAAQSSVEAVRLARSRAPPPPAAVQYAGTSTDTELSVNVANVDNLQWDRAGEWVFAAVDIRDCAAPQCVPEGLNTRRYTGSQGCAVVAPAEDELLHTLSREPLVKLAFISAPAPSVGKSLPTR